MTSRKALVSKNSQTSDDIMLSRFGKYIRDPYTDEKGDFKLEPIDEETEDAALVEFYQLNKQICGLYITGFLRILRPVNWSSISRYNNKNHKSGNCSFC